MADSSTIFTGSSRYASDFTQILDRAVAIASLPKTQLEQQKLTLNDRSGALTSLGAKAASLRSALTAVNDAVGLKRFSATSSDLTVAKATIATGVMAGSYSVTVDDIGGRSVALSSAEIDFDSAATLTLHANGKDYDPISVDAGDTPQEIVEAINAAGNGEIQATLINVAASGQTPKYHLSIQSTLYNSDTITLTDSFSNQLMDGTLAGSSVKYRINGYPDDPLTPEVESLESNSRALSIAPGLTVDALKAGSATITVDKATTALSNALSSFVNAFNSVVDEVDKHRGQGTGALKGLSIGSVLSDSLRRMMDHSQSGKSVTVMGEFGLEFNQQGKLEFDSSVMSDPSFASRLEDVFSFLGGTSTGGWLNSADAVLDSIDDSTTGLIVTENNTVKGQITAQDNQIELAQERIDRMEEDLVQRLTAADALIASLEQKVLFYQGMFDSMRESQKMYS
jgi:flagellar hook-associated protein 2